MKVRSDFVSNSSSCSFVIDAKHITVAQRLVNQKLHGLQVPFDIDEDIQVYLYAKNKNVVQLFKKMIEMEYIGDCYDFQALSRNTAQPDEMSWNGVCISVGQFVELMFQMDEQLCAIVEQIMFDTDDYGSGPMYLKDFYDFFERNQCYPNAENSEHEFIDSTRSEFKDVLKGIR